MGDLNLLTQLSTCFVLFCDWRMEPSILVTYSLFLISASAGGDQHFRISYHANSAAAVSPIPTLPFLELDLSQTAKMTYVLLLDRATLSQKNLWIDERGFVFVIFTICSLAEQLGRSTVSVSSALKELDAAGLIERRRTRFSSPNHIFVKIPNVE